VVVAVMEKYDNRIDGHYIGVRGAGEDEVMEFLIQT
jgi:hypothetical protein